MEWCDENECCPDSEFKTVIELLKVNPDYGMGDINASSLYFTAGFFDKHRLLTDLVRNCTSGQKKYHVKVIERENWQAHLQSRKDSSI